jgi:hypothetical protein
MRGWRRGSDENGCTKAKGVSGFEFQVSAKPNTRIFVYAKRNWLPAMGFAET